MVSYIVEVPQLTLLDFVISTVVDKGNIGNVANLKRPTESQYTLANEDSMAIGWEYKHSSHYSVCYAITLLPALRAVLVF